MSNKLLIKNFPKVDFVMHFFYNIASFFQKEGSIT